MADSRDLDPGLVTRDELIGNGSNALGALHLCRLRHSMAPIGGRGMRLNQQVTLNNQDLRHARGHADSKGGNRELKMRKDVQETLSEIRRQMLAAQQRNDCAEYHRLGAEHRGTLHAASAETQKAWEKARAAMDAFA